MMKWQLISKKEFVYVYENKIAQKNWFKWKSRLPWEGALNAQTRILSNPVAHLYKSDLTNGWPTYYIGS